jgi:hypothetical protein
MTFDPQAFLEAAYTESNDTKLIPVPEGTFPAIADKITPRTWTSKDGTSSGVALDITWIIEDESVKEHCARDTVTCRQGIMLDMTDEGKLDMGRGKNVGLGLLREALNMNEAGIPFSFANIAGRFANVEVKHRQNPQDPEVMFAEVKKAHKPE